jgi:hypothetical protein
MKELIRTNNPALLTFVDALLKEAGLSYYIADQNISVMDGSIGAFPRRVLIDAGDEVAARRILSDADLADELQKQK